MQVIIELSDLREAPAEVREWFLGRMGTLGGYADEAAALMDPKPEAKPKPKAKAEPKPEPEPPSMDDIMAKATAVLEEVGTDTLKLVLQRVGISRVKECPVEKRAQLLAELAVHV